MNERKRKIKSESGDERPSKKIALAAPPDIVDVRHVPVESEWLPILASAPGLVLSSKFSLKPYRKPRIKNGETSSEVLLHSSPHPRLEYTACEEDSYAIENQKKHYIGIYDPPNGELQLVEVRKAVIRGSAHAEEDNAPNSDEKVSSPNPLSARSILGLTFGTKKSKKAIRDRALNAIVSSPTKHSKSSPSSPSTPALDPVAAIILETMDRSTQSMLTRKEQQSLSDSAKPIPKPNFQATVPGDVYPLEQLISLEAMRILPVKDWMDRIESGEDIVTKSRFVSHRVRDVVGKGDVRRIKALKYLLVLVEWYLCLKPPSRDIRKVPIMGEQLFKIKGVDAEILKGVAGRFAESGTLNKWQTNNLLTHICALALTLDNFYTNTHDLAADLHLNQKQLTTLFKELGCRISTPTKAERNSLGLTTKDVPMHRFACLVVPLELPKLRVGRGKGRR